MYVCINACMHAHYMNNRHIQISFVKLKTCVSAACLDKLVARDQTRPPAKFVPSCWSKSRNDLGPLQAFRTSHRGLAASATKFAGVRSIAHSDSLAGQRNFPFTQPPPICCRKEPRTLTDHCIRRPWHVVILPRFVSLIDPLGPGSWSTGEVEAKAHLKIRINNAENVWNDFMELHVPYTSSLCWPSCPASAIASKDKAGL